MAKFVRLDVMSGNRDTSKVKSARYYDNNVVSEVENGTVVALSGLLDGEREIHKAVAAQNTDTYVGIVCTPEVCCDEITHTKIENFVNKAGDTIRVIIPDVGDIFSLGGVDSDSDIALGANLTGKHIATEICGRITYHVYEVQPAE